MVVDARLVVVRRAPHVSGRSPTNIDAARLALGLTRWTDHASLNLGTGDNLVPVFPGLQRLELLVRDEVGMGA